MSKLFTDKELLKNTIELLEKSGKVEIPKGLKQKSANDKYEFIVKASKKAGGLPVEVLSPEGEKVVEFVSLDQFIQIHDIVEPVEKKEETKETKEEKGDDVDTDTVNNDSTVDDSVKNDTSEEETEDDSEDDSSEVETKKLSKFEGKLVVDVSRTLINGITVVQIHSVDGTTHQVSESDYAELIKKEASK